jgi:two-component system, LytTR family, response regulator
MLAGDPAIRLAGVFASADEALAQLGRLPPQLLILNSQLPGCSELLRLLADQATHPELILVSACRDHFLDALAAGAVDYLVSPFESQRFARAVARVKVLVAHSQEPVTQASKGAVERTRLLISDRGRVVVLRQHDIEFVQAAGVHIKIYAGGQCYERRQSLTDIEQNLDAERFVRVHRSTVVNVEHIAEMHPLFHGDYELVLRRGTRLTLSRRYRERLKPFLLC